MGDGGGLEIFYIVKLIFAVAGLVGGLAFGTIGGLNLYTHGMKTIPETLDAQMNVAIADRQLPSDVDLYFLVTGIGAFGVGYMYLMKQMCDTCEESCDERRQRFVKSTTVKRH